MTCNLICDLHINERWISMVVQWTEFCRWYNESMSHGGIELVNIDKTKWSRKEFCDQELKTIDLSTMGNVLYYSTSIEYWTECTVLDHFKLWRKKKKCVLVSVYVPEDTVNDFISIARKVGCEIHDIVEE